ncbi:hypothetical protein [Haloferax sp. KTX1]|uniref:hypothetical protein n=1 Tax=Haloferax sp. KTX1 TaxID=2600597 RepID=UPI0011DD2178|nr:hypothetical protein [Haloferax sp. KTX1]
MLGIQLPVVLTSLLAAAFAFVFNLGVNWIVRKWNKTKEVRDWYQQMITLCERVNATVDLAQSMKEFDQKGLSEIYDDVNVKDVARESIEDDVSEDVMDQIAKEVEDEIAEEILETSNNKLVSDFRESFVSIRQHMVGRPRKIESEPEGVDQLMGSLWGLQVTHELEIEMDIAGRDLKEQTSNIIKQCESEIERNRIL